jgi:hypothetical protein
MMRGKMFAESDDCKSIALNHSLKAGLPYLNIDLDGSDLFIHLDPKDLPRIACLLRHAAESIEAIIAQNGANHAPEAILDRPAPSLASAA